MIDFAGARLLYDYFDPYLEPTAYDERGSYGTVYKIN